MTPEEKLDRYITIANELCAATTRFADESAATLKAKGYVMKLRDNVILGLALKTDSAFRALIDDARHLRIEAAHHLKTMVEAFIYMFVVGQDQTDKSAKRLLAEVCAKKEQYFRLNPAWDTSGEYGAKWADALKRYAADEITPIGGVGPAAIGHSSGLGTWYNAVYRAACEPAHISDLLEFMPSPALLDIEVGKVRTGLLHAQIAVEHGLRIMFDVVQLVNENDQGLSLDVTTLERDLGEISRTPMK